jgi:hypothetical protein
VDTWEVEKRAPLQFAQAWFSDDLDGEWPALARCRVATATLVTAVRPHPLSSLAAFKPQNTFRSSGAGRRLQTSPARTGARRVCSQEGGIDGSPPVSLLTNAAVALDWVKH